MPQYYIVLDSDNKEEIGTRRPVEDRRGNQRNPQWCAYIRRIVLAAKKGPLNPLTPEKLQIARRHLAICFSCNEWEGREKILDKRCPCLSHGL